MKTIGLFCGGFSSEFDISLKSAETIRTHFPKEFKVVRIIVSAKSWEVETDNGFESFDLNDCSFLENGIKKKIDAGLIYIHGNPGENGKVQAYLDMSPRKGLSNFL